MEALVILIIGAILIIILKKSPERGTQKSKSLPETISKLFSAVKKPHEEKQEEDKEELSKEKPVSRKEKDKDKKETPKVPAIVDRNEEKQRLLDEAEVFLKNNKLKEAEDCYIKILKIDEKDIPTYKGLGQIYLKRKNYKYALEIFQTLVELSPNEAANHCNLGMCYFKKKNFKKALESYEKTIALEEKPSYYKNLALSLDRLKRYEKAAETLEKSLKLYGEDEDIIMLMIRIITRIKDKKKTKKFASFLLGLDPENAVLKRELFRLT